MFSLQHETVDVLYYTENITTAEFDFSYCYYWEWKSIIDY